MDQAEIEKRFTYHPPLPGQPEIYTTIRENAKQLAICITSLSPESREQSLAITSLEEAVFWANAAIARNPQGKILQQSWPEAYHRAAYPLEPRSATKEES